MPLRAMCPSCRAKVVVDDAKAGSEIVCHQCGAGFTAPSIMAAPPATFAEAAGYFEEESRAQPRSASPDSRDVRDGMTDGPAERDRPNSDDFRLPAIVTDAAGRWRATVIGLGIMFWATVAIVVLLLPMLVMAGISGAMEKEGAGQPPAPEHVALVFSMLGLLCLMGILMIVYFVGMCLCCTVPPESGAKVRAITGVVLLVLIVVGGGFAFFFLIVRAVQMQAAGGGRADPFGGEVGLALGLIFGAAGLLFSTVWMLFHRAVALHFDNRRLARSVIFYLFANYAFTVIIVLLMLSAVGAPPEDPNAGLAGACSLFSNAALLIWFLTILRRTRSTITEGTAASHRRLLDS